MLLRVPFDQGQGFNDRTGKPAVVDGKPEEDEEKANDHGHRFPENIPVYQAFLDFLYQLFPRNRLVFNHTRVVHFPSPSLVWTV